MNPTVIPDPQSLLPAMPPIVVVVFHWLVLLVAVIFWLGVGLAFIWAFWKDSWVKQYKTDYPETVWSRRIDRIITLATNFPQYMNKKAKEKGLPAPFKFVAEDLTIPPPPIPDPKYTVTVEDYGRARVIRQVATGKTRIVSAMAAVAAGLPHDRPWNDAEASLAYDMAEPYVAPIMEPAPPVSPVV